MIKILMHILVLLKIWLHRSFICAAIRAGSLPQRGEAARALPPRPPDPRRPLGLLDTFRRGAGRAIDRMRERRQPAAGAGRQPAAGACRAPGVRCKPRPPGAQAPTGRPLLAGTGGGSRWPVAPRV